MQEYVMNLVQSFVAVWDNSDFAPAHIVLSDFNLDDGSIKFSLDYVNRLLDGTATPDEKDTHKLRTVAELRSTAFFLQMLLEIDEEYRDLDLG